MTTTTRPTWPETWMEIARTIAKRSYSQSLQVGAIVVSSDNTQMLSGGYNGNYAGGPNVEESTEPGQSGFIHAEVNALIKLDFNFPKAKHMYVTHSPCRMCAKLIVNAGIKLVVFGVAYRDPSGVDLLRSARVLTVSLEEAVAHVRAYKMAEETTDADGNVLRGLDHVESTERPGHRATVGPINADGTFEVCDSGVGLFVRQRPDQWRKVDRAST